MSETTIVTAPEITCMGCATSIKKALEKVDGINDVSVDVVTKKVTVDHNERVDRETIATALDNAGFSID